MYKKYPILRVKFEDLKLDKDIAIELVHSGISMGFMLSFVAIGTVALQSAINTFGQQTIVAHLAARKIIEMMMMPISIFASAAATFSSQNLGAGKIERIKTGIIQCIIMMWIWCVIAILITIFFSETLIKLLTTTTDTNVISTAITYLKFNVPFLFIEVILVILRNAMQGIGDRISPILSSLIELAGKFAVVIFLKNFMGYWGVIISEPIVWFLCALHLVIRLLKNPIMQFAFKEKETKNI